MKSTVFTAREPSALTARISKAGEDEKMEKLKTVKWYNKTRWLNWIPGIKTEPQILEENRRIMERIRSGRRQQPRSAGWPAPHMMRESASSRWWEESCGNMSGKR
jgi:hypothetical protein